MKETEEIMQKDVVPNDNQDINAIEIQDTPKVTSPSDFQKILAVFLLLLSIGYMVSPIDPVPDVIPVLGWFDDLLIVMVGGMNFVQQFMQNQNSFSAKVLKYCKWFLVLLFIIVILLFIGLVVLGFVLVKTLNSPQ